MQDDLSDVQAARTEPAGDGLGSVLAEAARPEAARPEAARPETVRPETVRVEAARPEAVRVELMTAGHAAQVLAIYQAGIDEGNATFETRAPSWAEFSVARLPGHRFVAVEPGTDAVVGWVAISATSSRPVYAGVVEHSVYVHPGARGRRIGRLLLGALITSTEAAGIWTIQAGVFPENTASIALHHATGFRIVGTRERFGRQHGRWRDIVLMERRSPAL